MTRTEHLLWILAEECNEIAHRVSKAARFGLHEIQPGQTFTNAERIMHELFDLLVVVDLLYDEAEAQMPSMGEEEAQARSEAKKAKVEQFLNYSRQCRTLG